MRQLLTETRRTDLKFSAASYVNAQSAPIFDLKPDPKAIFGSLENGLRYLVLPHDEPPGRASIRLYMDVGSLMEEDDQQGMAHFLEHMAFNGTRTFKGGEDGDMVKFFQRLGMGFGADTNPREGVRLLGGLGLSFDLCVRWHQLDEVVGLVEQRFDGSRWQAREVEAPFPGTLHAQSLHDTQVPDDPLGEQYLLTASNTKGHRRIGDLVAGTFVVHRSAEGRLLHIPGLLHVQNRHEYGAFGPAPAAAAPAPGSDAPVFDPARNTYVRYDPASGVWFQWDEASQSWVPTQQ